MCPRPVKIVSRAVFTSVHTDEAEWVGSAEYRRHKRVEAEAETRMNSSSAPETKFLYPTGSAALNDQRLRDY